MTTHAYAFKAGRSYLEFDSDNTLRTYFKRYFHISKRWEGYQGKVFNIIGEFLIAFVAPMIKVVVGVDSVYRNKKVVRFLNSNAVDYMLICSYIAFALAVTIIYMRSTYGP